MLTSSGEKCEIVGLILAQCFLTYIIQTLGNAESTL